MDQTAGAVALGVCGSSVAWLASVFVEKFKGNNIKVLSVHRYGVAAEREKMVPGTERRLAPVKSVYGMKGYI